jgi:hypothetical protein
MPGLPIPARKLQRVKKMNVWHVPVCFFMPVQSGIHLKIRFYHLSNPEKTHYPISAYTGSGIISAKTIVLSSHVPGVPVPAQLRPWKSGNRGFRVFFKIPIAISSGCKNSARGILPIPNSKMSRGQKDITIYYPIHFENYFLASGHFPVEIGIIRFFRVPLLKWIFCQPT